MPDIPEKAVRLVAEILRAWEVDQSGEGDIGPVEEFDDDARELLDALDSAGLVVVSADDLDIVLNRGDEAVGWSRYSAACNRLRAALPDRNADG